VDLKNQEDALKKEIERMRKLADQAIRAARYEKVMIAFFVCILSILLLLELVVLGVHGKLVTLPYQANFFIPAVFCAALAIAIFLPFGRHFHLAHYPDWVAGKMHGRWGNVVTITFIVALMFAIFAVALIIALP